MDDAFEKIQDFTAFILIYTVLLFALGIAYGVYFAKGEQLWYPVYLLMLLLAWKVLKDAGRSKKKKEEK